MLYIKVALLWCSLFFIYRVIKNRIGRPPIDDFGVLWVLVLVLYSTLPPLVWAIGGGEYSVLFGGRLFSLEPGLDDQSYLLNIYIAYAFGFISTYYFFSPKHISNPASPCFVANRVLRAAAILFVIGFCFDKLLRATGGIRVATSYEDAYLAMAEMPMWLAQIYKISQSIANFSLVIVMVAILQRGRKYYPLFFLYILATIATYDISGARGGVVIGLIQCLICWHVIVRPFSSQSLVVGGGIGIFIFNLLGAIRGAKERGDIVGSINPLAIGDFLEIWANGVHLHQLNNAGELTVPLAVLLSELFSFIPNQIIPFEKFGYAEWYVDTFYPGYKSAGGGLAFGALSQAVIGGGVVEALIRGGALGMLSGWFMSKVRAKVSIWWIFPLSVLLLSSIYHSIRSNIFSQVNLLIQTAIPAILMINLLLHFGSSLRAQKG